MFCVKERDTVGLMRKQLRPKKALEWFSCVGGQQFEKSSTHNSVLTKAKILKKSKAILKSSFLLIVSASVG